MSKKIKSLIVLSIALIGILIISYLFFSTSKKTNKKTTFIPTVHAPTTTQSEKDNLTANATQNDVNQKLIKPDGNINDIISNIMNNAKSEDSLINQEITDTQTATDNSQDLNNFSQSYDSNQF